jgi:basic membrane lipoprotein Med (substrate-binding protein (PBP1-ABC) superfamily)
MESRIVRICRAGDQLPMLVSVCNLVVHGDGPTLQDVQTNSTETVDVGVVDLGKEADLGWSHGVVVGQEQLELEDSAWLVCQKTVDAVDWD